MKHIIFDWKDWDKRRNALSLLTHKTLIKLCYVWARKVLPIFEEKYPNDKRPRLAIEAAENTNYAAAVNAAWAAADAAWAAAYPANTAEAAWAAADAANAYVAANAAYVAWAAAAAYAAWADNTVFVAAAANAAHAAAYAANADDLWEWTYKTYLQAIGPQDKILCPFNDNISRLLEILKMDYTIAPILADALEENGCINQELLDHLRKDEIFPSDWILNIKGTI